MAIIYRLLGEHAPNLSAYIPLPPLPPPSTALATKQEVDVSVKFLFPPQCCSPHPMVFGSLHPCTGDEVEKAESRKYSLIGRGEKAALWCRKDMRVVMGWVELMMCGKCHRSESWLEIAMYSTTTHGKCDSQELTWEDFGVKVNIQWLRK